MTGWILTAGLQNLLRQINAWAPDRDHTSDGEIGDTAHQAGISGHDPDDVPGSHAEWNGDPDSTPEVRAIDIDTDFRNGATAQQLVDHIVGLKPSSVLRYVIYNRRIYEASNGWKPRPYTGPSPHTEHLHASGAYTQAADNDTTFDYRLEEIPVALTADDKKWIAAEIAGILNLKIGDKAWPDRTVGDHFRDDAKLRDYEVGDKAGTKNAAIPATAPIARRTAAADSILEPADPK